MDEKALTELLECSVCLDQLDHTSKVLPCQHTFCKRCLDEIFSTKNELRCPECRFLVEMRVEDLPANILLIRLLEGLKTQARVTSSSSGQQRDQGSPGSGRVDRTSQLGSRHHQERQGNGVSRPCAKALFNFEGKEAGDLKFQKGDMVYLRKKVDENWYHGEMNGNHGFFPASYVQVITPIPTTVPQCKGLYDFNMDNNKEEDCLSFRKNEVVTVIRKVDGNWLEGKKGDKIGIFPISFVELNDPAKILLQLSGSNSTSQEKGPPATPAHPIMTDPQKNGSPHRLLNNTVLGPNGQSQEAVPSTVPSSNKRHSLTSITQTVSVSGSSPNQRHSLELEPDSNNIGSAGSRTSNQLASPASTKKLTEPVPHESTSVNKPEGQVPDKTMTAAVGSDDQKVVGASATSSRTVSEEAMAITGVMARYVALYNYRPQKPDEIELYKGDYYSVSEKCQDGWYKGIHIRSGISGVFPGNYVQPVKNHSSSYKPHSKGNGSSRSKGHGSSNSSSSSSSSPHISGQIPTSVVAKNSSPGSQSRHRISPARSSSEERKPSSRSMNRSGSEEREIAPPPIVPRGHKSSSPISALTSAISNTSNPHISTSAKTTRYVRASKSANPNTSSGAAAAAAAPSAGKHSSEKASGKSAAENCHGSASSSLASGNEVPTSAASPVWKHSLSASAHITPPNVSVGATGKSVPIPNPGMATPPASVVVPKDKEKKEKKDKEKLSLMKRLTVGGKSKKSKYGDGEMATSGELAVNHSRSGSCPSDVSALAHLEGGHKKSGSFDSTIPPASAGPTKPSRPKPLVRQKYRCIESYPPQSEIELGLKIGDIIYVHKKREDGWFKGTLQRSGKTGLFPGLFAEKCE